jgi:hypothetical protein
MLCPPTPFCNPFKCFLSTRVALITYPVWFTPHLQNRYFPLKIAISGVHLDDFPNVYYTIRPLNNHADIGAGAAGAGVGDGAVVSFAEKQTPSSRLCSLDEGNRRIAAAAAAAAAGSNSSGRIKASSGDGNGNGDGGSSSGGSGTVAEEAGSVLVTLAFNKTLLGIRVGPQDTVRSLKESASRFTGTEVGSILPHLHNNHTTINNHILQSHTTIPHNNHTLQSHTTITHYNRTTINNHTLQSHNIYLPPHLSHLTTTTTNINTTNTGVAVVDMKLICKGTVLKPDSAVSLTVFAKHIKAGAKIMVSAGIGVCCYYLLLFVGHIG